MPGLQWYHKTLGLEHGQPPSPSWSIPRRVNAPTAWPCMEPSDLQTIECLKNDIWLGGVTAKKTYGGEQHMAHRREVGLCRPYTGLLYVLGDPDPGLEGFIEKCHAWLPHPNSIKQRATPSCSICG